MILRHGGEAQAARDAFAALGDGAAAQVLDVPQLARAVPAGRHRVEPRSRATAAPPGFPQFGHGSIKLPVLFNDPSDLE